ncbi:GNAT family N-acetyltransferase [Sphingomonas sp. FW199]|uniref:GNAT family N-acetyltransferase n=1 Tax=Sphingomonas sp. FW199 TaxID=3400217 RepID=UPI003CE9A6DB
MQEAADKMAGGRAEEENRDDRPPVAHLLSGYPAVIDRTCALDLPSHQFLRRSWFGNSRTPGARTLYIERVDRTPLAAIPIEPANTSFPGINAVGGGYWPFRSFPAAADLTSLDLARALSVPRIQQGIGPVLRIGPAYAGDRAALLMREAAAMLGWQILVRRLGTRFVQQVDDRMIAEGALGRSRRRRIAGAERRLAELGTIAVGIVRGAEWCDVVLNDLGRIEAQSWIGTDTDRSGAKFIDPAARRRWLELLADRHLAERLHATILYVDHQPVAFSFDLIAGTMLYAIASGYDPAFARFGPGMIVTRHSLDHAIASGVRTIDWGCGDTGYKTEMGATPDQAIEDWLIVRGNVLAAALRPVWEDQQEPMGRAVTAGLSGAMSELGTARRSRMERLIMPGLAVAAAAMMMSE